MSNGRADYISATVACMRTSSLRKLINDLRYMGCHEAAICMVKYNKDTASNYHVATRYHYL